MVVLIHRLLQQMLCCIPRSTLSWCLRALGLLHEQICVNNIPRSCDRVKSVQLRSQTSRSTMGIP